MNLSIEVQERSALRPNSRDGLGARANFIDAIKFLYRCAVADHLIPQGNNPTRELRRPAKQKSTRRPLTTAQLSEINEVAATTGIDPALTALIIRLHIETACRRGGSKALRPCDLDTKQLTVGLREKGNTVRDQPVSPSLMDALLAHERYRAPDHDRTAQLLRHRNGRPIPITYYDQIWKRIGRILPWVSTLGVTSHWLRYTTLTWVERNFGYAVAAAYAGHVQTSGRTGNTLTYVSATIEEVAAALVALTGEPYPLAAIGPQ
ncbi:site-specific integrase [Amycolatopsis rubida]|uniref:Site-specific integrase n=1 Tax=Amycolatopsis rubida TaxID=112413 RepID=A0ABX0C3C8_9PSEU|nr:site-specific integrase [Amycolatopsis rubida]MYW96071.1 site-specific integrase [Amycolatopsis rubida]NEC61062.1 site-specific integrase [Amycolatopsis rubida]